MIKNLKTILKKNKYSLGIYEAIFQRPLINIFRTNYKRRVLFSYSTYHFNNKNYIGHSSYKESLIIADIFNEIGFQVDIINNNRFTNLNIEDYDVIFGEGLPMFQALQLENRPFSIYYGTGSHPFHCNNQSYKRVINFYSKYAFLADKSMRATDSRWGIAASCSDAVICIGNEHTNKSFIDQGAKRVFSIDPTFHLRDDAIDIARTKNFSSCKKSILWFGSYGLLHKGLDLAVEAIRKHKDWTLHVCGYTSSENDFVKSLNIPTNVVFHGFIDVLSNNFRNIALNAGYVILPSCSEGTATSIITAVGNGAMIPIVTKECGFDVQDAGFIIELDPLDIEKKIMLLDSMDAENLYSIGLRAQGIVLDRYNEKNFTDSIRKKINLILYDL